VTHPALAYGNLEQAMNALGGPLKMLRSSTLGVYHFPVVQPEYTSWIEEQRSWMTGVALSNLSFHMTHLYLRGPDVLAFLRHVSCTRLGDFPVNRGKQLMVVNERGHFIGDNVAFHTSDGVYRLSGPDIVTHWLQYQLEIGKWDVQAEKDASQNFRAGDPLIYSYQVQGPHAVALMQEICEGPFPEIKFFHIGEFSIAGVPVRALRHGMAGVPGFELFGPWADAGRIMAALETAGEKYGLRKIGGRTYPTTCLESGWLAMPVPGIYTGDDMKPYREWLSSRTIEVLGSLGGSFSSDNIEDYYMTPFDMGYGAFTDVEVDCIGHAALAEIERNPRRRKVALVWNADDVAQVMRSSFADAAHPAVPIELPLSTYSTYHYDAVVKDGRNVGVSTYCGVSSNAKAFLSIGVVDVGVAVGESVEVLWGEPDSSRPTVPKNTMHKVRATVAPMPYFQKVNKTA